MSFSIPPPSTFLSLAPVTSEYFPVAPAVVASSPSNDKNTATTVAQEPAAAVDATTIATASSSIPEVTEVIPDAAIEVQDIRTRRSSSISSTTSLSSKKRFLKLAPVFYGLGDGKGTGDWSEEVVAETE